MKWQIRYHYPEPTGWASVYEHLTTEEVIEWLEEHNYMTADIEISPANNPTMTKEEFLSKYDVP